jgi:hypothetical protein
MRVQVPKASGGRRAAAEYLAAKPDDRQPPRISSLSTEGAFCVCSALQSNCTKLERACDPEAFAAKLAYTDEVKQLGFSHEDAEAFGIGFCRGHVYFPTRYASGQIAGWCALIQGN